MVQSDFTGLNAIVTGGASGIGLATARELSERGARVAVLDLATDVEPPLLGIHCDVTDTGGVDGGVAEAAATLGGIDIVIANAGIGAQGTVADNDDDEWRRVLDVNVLGVTRVVRAALPHLRSSDAAAVVITSSIVAWAGLPQRALYGASKGALSALALALAADHVADGIRVNAVAPGTADTPWIGRLLAAASDPQHERAALEARQPMGRLVSAEEVAWAICYLASPRSASTTGTILAVDGGMYGLRLRPRAPDTPT
jgi:NAD(P)-dependent dehydrogenase (short-subunit alcohol dehydrogenase family)